MTFRTAAWLVSALAGIGILILLYTLVGFLREVIFWVTQPRVLLGRTEVSAKQRESEKFIAFEFPWSTAYVIAVPTTVLLWFMLEGVPLQAVALGVLLFPVLIRYWLARQRQREGANEVRQFLVELRLQLSSGGTLRPALQAVAQFGPPNLRRLLRNRLASQESGPRVLRQLAEDTGSRWIRDIAGRAEAAQEGTLNMDEAVSQSIDRITEEMDTQIREELQQIPTRLIIIVAPLLLGPTLALWVYPIVARVLANLSGTTFFGGF